ncbi:MAG: aspartate aminotransferase family protein [Gammaproteobacteria bacterium]|nr:aspartate aminotransferase family protein [Gammaproteobacteria bacterium]
MSATDDLWPFLPGRKSLKIVAAQGATLVTDDGREILDLAGGAIAVNVGHGRAEVARAIAAEAERLTYVVPPWATPSREQLVSRLRQSWLPPSLNRAYFASGGSEANETAMKVAVQHFASRGLPRKSKIIGRELSYHGTTLATTGLGGHAARRIGLEAVLQDHPRAPTPYPLRAPTDWPADQLGRCYADALEAVIDAEGPETVAAVMAEPIVGSSGGALIPPEDYWPRIRALCDRHDILLIFDEVMTGFGRTGRRFACEHWDLAPDLLVAGKGLAGGYAPIGGLFASDAVLEPIAASGGEVMFHTFGAHPAACAAADAVLAILEREELVARSAALGVKLSGWLNDAFADHPHVAESRGCGLLQAIEVVADRETLEPFPQIAGVTRKIVAAGLERGIYAYWGGTGVIRDIVCLGPPFTITEAELQRGVAILRDAVDAALAGLRR